MDLFRKFIQCRGISKKRKQIADYYIRCSEFAIDAIKNPVAFMPVNLGGMINTENDEYINAVRSDELEIYFTGRTSNGDLNNNPDDDFYRSLRAGILDPWDQSMKLGPPINTPGNEGALTITHDGRYLLFAGCHWPDGMGSCDIYAAELSDGKILDPKNLGSMVNTYGWESQPSLGSDGRTLYFTGSRPGGYGKSDIWVTRLGKNGEWSVPENMGERINTSGSEMAPFIHPDGQTLYFSSDWGIGMGGIDLYVSRLDSTGNWSEPENLGYPLNTSGNEINIVVNARGDRGYISANQLGGLGGYDIFEFDLHEKIRPVSATYIKGVVTDAETHGPVGAYFTLIDLKSANEIVTSSSDRVTGSFLVCLPTNRDYALNVSKEGYLFYSENFSLSDTNSQFEPYLINIELQPVRKGESMVLRNIFFDTDAYVLKAESLAELGKLVGFLEYNPGIAIEIGGHTDDVGGGIYNLELSEKRAAAVYHFLIEHGIGAQRLRYKGYGFSIPLDDNTTEDGRAKNRRTEIQILQVD
nr:PD40 domain-containing protein [Bacteroidota bacterium]